jgi:hypothetical protein
VEEEDHARSCAHILERRACEPTVKKNLPRQWAVERKRRASRGSSSSAVFTRSVGGASRVRAAIRSLLVIFALELLRG